MTGKDAIIEKILTDAQNKRDSIIAEADANAEKLIDDAKASCQTALIEEKAKYEATEKELIRRKLSVATLDAKKNNLAVKQRLLETAFVTAHKKVIELPDKEYLALIGKLIVSFAEVGEVVTIAANDSKRITQEFLTKFGKELSLSKTHGDFDGGIILSKQGYDKNLTLDVLMVESREQLEDKVAEALFLE